jgi:dipeptidyl-peptidase-4
MRVARKATIAAAVPALIGAGALLSTQRIYWADEVPQGWNGTWPAELRTVAETSAFTRTMTTAQLHEYINVLRWRSENMHVVNLFTSPLGRIAPAMVLASPRVTSAQQARQSGRNVIFLMGNIHPDEAEAAEALLLVARHILLGAGRALLDSQVVVIAPIFNVDGTDTRTVNSGSLGSVTPHIAGVRPNSQGLDLNREGVKLETVEANGLYRFLNTWDPILLLDGHLMGRVTHGYANTYGTTTVPAAHPGPRAYMNDSLFPAVRESVRRSFGLEVFTHALFTPGWPPAAWSHDRAAWTTEAKFIVNAYGLRNRFAIITETPGQPTFEKRTYAQYAYLLALLEYTNANARRMADVVRHADEETVARVLADSGKGTLTNWLAGEYRSRGKIDVYGYRSNVAEYIPGTSVLGTRQGTASGAPELVRGVDDLTEPVGTRSAAVPRAYILLPELRNIALKLEAHNVRVRTLQSPMRVEGDEFLISRMQTTRSAGYDMTTLDGMFRSATREFPAGSFYVDMAQPMANAIFYYLEPQSADGFVGWHVLDEALRAAGADRGEAVYPIFKVRRPG